MLSWDGAPFCYLQLSPASGSAWAPSPAAGKSRQVRWGSISPLSAHGQRIPLAAAVTGCPFTRDLPSAEHIALPGHGRQPQPAALGHAGEHSQTTRAGLQEVLPGPLGTGAVLPGAGTAAELWARSLGALSTRPWPRCWGVGAGRCWWSQGSLGGCRNSDGRARAAEQSGKGKLGRQSWTCSLEGLIPRQPHDRRGQAL